MLTWKLHSIQLCGRIEESQHREQLGIGGAGRAQQAAQRAPLVPISINLQVELAARTGVSWNGRMLKWRRVQSGAGCNANGVQL